MRAIDKISSHCLSFLGKVSILIAYNYNFSNYIYLKLSLLREKSKKKFILTFFLRLFTWNHSMCAFWSVWFVVYSESRDQYLYNCHRCFINCTTPNVVTLCLFVDDMDSLIPTILLSKVNNFTQVFFLVLGYLNLL